MIHLPTKVLETRRDFAHCALENTDMTSWLKIVNDDGRGFIEVRIDEDNTCWLKKNDQ